MSSKIQVSDLFIISDGKIDINMSHEFTDKAQELRNLILEIFKDEVNKLVFQNEVNRRILAITENSNNEIKNSLENRDLRLKALQEEVQRSITKG